MIRITALLLFSALFMPCSSLHAEDVRPIETTTAELIRKPHFYHGKLVRLEGVVDTTPEPYENNGVSRYPLWLDDDPDITCLGKPSVVKGDHVRVTGKFIYDEHTYGVYFLRVEPPRGSVEKVAKEHQRAAGPQLTGKTRLSFDRPHAATAHLLCLP